MRPALRIRDAPLERTSLSHPLRIAWLKVPAGWRVGLTFAPGKCGPSREGLPWRRDGA